MYRGHAEFVDEHKIKVISPTGEQTLEFSRAVVCTGAKPFIPYIPGLSAVNYLTNESIFNLTKLPQRLAIIGAGPVGIEMAQAFACFGSKVVVFDTNERIMANEDKEACDIIQNKLHKLLGVEFYFNCRINNISEKSSENDTNSDDEDDDDDDLDMSPVVITIRGRPHSFDEEESISSSHGYEDEQKEILTRKLPPTAFIENESIASKSINQTEHVRRLQSLKGIKSVESGYVRQDFNVMSTSLVFDAVFVSTGQRPNVENVGLDQAGIQYHRNRGIVVNDFLQTTNPDVYAAGDCCSRYQYTHMALSYLSVS